MPAGHILAIDQGTTGTRALVVNAEGQLTGQAYHEITQHYPQPGWVEHDPREILEKSLAAADEASAAAGINGQFAAIGISNQRETTVVWDAQTGEPLYPAIVWQCRRTAPLCAELRASGLAELITDQTGLVIDPYFSATKLRWLLDNVPGLRQRAEHNEVRFGTIDSWLIWHLTGGRVHATDYSNASRTMLFDIHRLKWSSEILRELHIPPELLPAVRGSSEVLGESDGAYLASIGSKLPGGIPVAGVAGDQQAALFGQACFRSGMVKTTYGTGAFLLMNTGDRAIRSSRGLLTTIAWRAGNKLEYALEGSLFIAGAAIQWLRDQLGLIHSAAESASVAAEITDTDGVYLVPAFVGLGAPYWDAYARGIIVGITRGTGRPHLVRAALESIAYQTRDVVEVMTAEAATRLEELRIDGGAAANDFLAQFQADLLGVPVVRPRITDTTGLGAAYLAGLATGVWRTKDDLSAQWQVGRRFEPTMPESERERHYTGWLRAVERARGWANE